MEIESVFSSPAGSFSKKEEEFLARIISEHAEKIATILPFKQEKLTFVISPRTKGDISAFAKACGLIEISINPDGLRESDNRRKKIIEQLIYIIYHEMHHVCRGYVGELPEGEEHILIGSIISEGLADSFAAEQYPSAHILRKNDVDFSEIGGWLGKIKEVMWNKERADDSWLYGGKGKPAMLGYKIGRFIIQKVKENNQNADSVKLVNSSPKEILELSGIRLLN
ncbi:MAG: hypothetical protein ACD_15C00100G0003 [uncultured bacterium]|nr:MAG: hypothetical protein ACD_15C00100G0003 [uncultured bacterium]KKT88966.1 MAG: hypothetical protein UW87_C0009G0030 [Candidatus Moranbacteria bacterium GW2011_GWC2_45_10]KKT95110.1 MAG: hypothetical protein UW95_C0004G0028 [Parcubacteria group bacterium GW2011_GWC1_45_14]HAV11259.1 hypothetical protein [Candidatus Moranbacteria bacterium]